MSETITVGLGERAYDIHVGGGMLERAGALLKPLAKGVVPIVTDSHVAWKLTKGAPHNPSTLLIGDELYVVSDKGILTCVDAKTGEQHYQERLGGNFSASPLFADGRIYLLDEDGKCTVIAPGKEYKVLAENQLPGRTLASISTADGAMFLRTDTALYRLRR